MKTDVMIIGAGPTGLSLACQLIRYGIDFVIVDQKEGVTPLSKALGVQARTMEIYEQLGLSAQALEQGTIADKIKLISGGKVHDGFDLSEMGKGVSPYPYMLVLEQSKNEQMLYEYLQQRQQNVRWNTALENFSQDDSGVRADVREGDSEPYTISAKYLVGCDGGRSPVRHILDLDFVGNTNERLFYVADTKIEWEMSHDALHGCFGRDSLIFFFPMPSDKCWRVLGNLPEQTPADKVEMDKRALQQQVQAVTGLALEITEINWFSSYRVHTRHVQQFSKRRCFLAGDAAHVHTPAGGQGMNTGIQDAYNLAWKLSFVLRGYADEALLETYDQERLENAKNLVESTDRIFELQTGANWLVGLLRTTVLPPLAKHIFSFDVVQKGVFSLVSETGISYPDSPLSLDFEAVKLKMKAGDRMPYCFIEGKSIYNKLRDPKFHALTFLKENSPAELAVSRDDSEQVNYRTLPLSDSVAKAFGTDESFSLLLRPDNHISFIAQNNFAARLDDYFNRIGQQEKATGVLSAA